MHYPYNAIFGRGMLNTFKAALHSAYLCLKVPASLGVKYVHGNQKDARNIEQGFAPRHKNVNFQREAEGGGQQDTNTPKAEAHSGGKTTIEAECDRKRVTLDPTVPNKTVLIAQDLSSEEEAEMFSFLDKNSDVFA
jgi:hypothetical protein